MNNTATTAKSTYQNAVYSSIYYVARPIYGTMAHSGYVQTVTYDDGYTNKNVGTFCSVTVQYNPSKSPAMPLDEVAAIITCPKCIKRTANRLGVK